MRAINYYWVRNDAGGQHPQIVQLNRTPGWGLNVFYESEEELASRGADRFDTRRYQLAFKRASGSFASTDFVYFNPSVLTCGRDKFSFFSEVVSGHCVEYPLLIGLEPYISFRPSEHFDILDRDKSIFSESSSGTLHNFKKLIISSPPRDDTDFFGVMGAGGKPTMQIVVSDAFKEIYDSNRMAGLLFDVALRSN